MKDGPDGRMEGDSEMGGALIYTAAGEVTGPLGKLGRDSPTQTGLALTFLLNLRFP